MANPPKIILGVTGSISAYKAPLLLRALQDAGYDPWPVLTAAATQYVTPLVLRVLSRHDVPVGDFAATPDPGTFHHILLAADAAAMIVAPCSANTLAQLAHGLAPSILAATALALPPSAPLLVAPAMNANMLLHPATQQNLDILRQRGATIILAPPGPLACGAEGPGRLPDPPDILAALRPLLPPPPDGRSSAGHPSPSP